MILLICAENRGGILFFGKRLSRDRFLTAHILSLVGDAPLHVTPYSAALFEGAPNLKISDTPEKNAGKGEYYFAENAPLPEGGVEQLHRFLWNRDYPADRFFDPAALGAERVGATELKGFSHDVITDELWEVKK